MKTLVMDEKVGETRLDRNPQGILGKPVDRYEGPLKVSGRATYAAEYLAGEDCAHGFVVMAKQGKGRLVKVDGSAAEAMPGVLAVIHGAAIVRNSAEPMSEAAKRNEGRVHHYGQPVALVVAESYEAARHAARSVKVEIEAEDGRYAIDGRLDEARASEDGDMDPVTERGDFEKAFAQAEYQFDKTYTTPSHHASAMEPHASVAQWDGDRLTVWSSCQLLETNVQQIAAGVGIEADKVRLLSPYVGGGFGSKLGIGPDAVLAALGARAAGKPVKVALTRPDVYQMTSRRSETIQRIRIGATRDGRITAIGHETFAANTPDYGFFEPAGISTVFLYAGNNRHVSHRIIDTDTLMTSAVRAPGEAVGMLALENAMDEAAEALGIDPVEFRRMNEPDRDPQEDKPFSSRKLIDCMDEGARRFGWDRRPEKPRSRREGDWYIGYGMAAASRKNLLMQSSARVTLTADGGAVIHTAMTDIGTGSYTILQQIAAEMLALPLEKIEVHLGDTDLPPSSGSGGSWGANSTGSAVYLACEAIIEALAKKLDTPPDELTLTDGHAIAGNRRIAYRDLLDGTAIEKEGTIKKGKTYEEMHQASYGAHFCEVGVNAVTGETRVRRLLTVAAAGRIFNEKTARSQCYGGQIWGIGSALMEDLAIDARSGLIVNHDLAEYHVPAHADIAGLEVVFLEERDEHASPLAGKGIGELALAGVGAAVTNAIHNACGVRVKDYPMTLDKVIAGLEG